MKKRIIYLAVLLTVGAAAVAALLHARSGAALVAAAAPPSKQGAGIISAAGKVEPVSEEVKLGAEIAGVLRSVTVEEGQWVRKGAVIAVIDNGDFDARVAAARAAVAERAAALERLENGAREQERGEAQAAVEEAKAVLRNDRAEASRKQSLLDTGDISRSEWERADREASVAEARLRQAEQRASFVDAPARADERNRAQADLAMARAQSLEAEALLAKTVVRAPFDGTVLKRFHKAGETVSDKNDPIVSFGDDSRLRVRMEVDETDVGKALVGSRAYVKAEAFGAAQFWGKVVRVGSELGRKNIDTGDPGDKVDTRVLETLIELDGHPPLPPGLRVDAYVMADGKGN